MKKIILTGSNGILGTEFRRLFPLNSIEVQVLDYRKIFSLSEASLAKVLEGADAVIHCAANTNVDLCEINKSICYNDNVRLTDIIARCSKLALVKFVFISSAGVYGDYKNQPYSETDELHPTTFYHRFKVVAENKVMELDPGNLVLRAGWLFGGNFSHPKNFVARRLEEIIYAKSQNEIIKSNKDQTGCPSWTRDVANAAISLLAFDGNGIFNVCNSGYASRYSYVKEICKVAVDLGLPKIDMEGVQSSQFCRPARVSNNEMAVNAKLQKRIGFPMPDWKVSLRAYMTELGVPPGLNS